MIVPFERPPQFGTRQFLTDDEYARRLEEVRVRDEGDLAPVDVLSGKVDGAFGLIGLLGRPLGCYGGPQANPVPSLRRPHGHEGLPC